MLKIIILLFISYIVSPLLFSQEDSIRHINQKTVEQEDTIRLINQKTVEQEDSTQTVGKKWYQTQYIKESIVPVTLAMASATIMVIPDLKKNLQNKLNWNNDQNPSYKNLGDDFVRYLPTITTYLLSDALHDYGFKAKHRFFERTAIITVAYIASDFVVYRTKKLTQVHRPVTNPSGGEDYSFPSQHTAMAFVGATFLHKELGHISPWISVGGYLAASYVGYSRIARNRHWTSDVLMGATVGMLITHATYWAYDGIMSLFSKTDKKSVSMTPYTDLENVGISFSVQF